MGFNRYLTYDSAAKKWEERKDESDDANVIRFFVMKHRRHSDKYRVVFISDFERGLFFSKKATDLYEETQADKGVSADKFTQEMENF